MVGSQLVENTWSFKPIAFEESVIFLIKNISESVIIRQIQSKPDGWSITSPYPGIAHASLRRWLSSMSTSIRKVTGSTPCQEYSKKTEIAVDPLPLSGLTHSQWESRKMHSCAIWFLIHPTHNSLSSVGNSSLTIS